MQIQLVQQREYYSRKALSDNAVENRLLFFDEAGDNRNTNMDIANQINNSGVFQVHKIHTDITLPDGDPLTVGTMPTLNKIISSAFFKFSINQIKVLQLPMSRLLRQSVLAAGTDFAESAPDSVQGFYHLSLPLLIGYGNSFEFEFVYNTADDASGFEVLWGLDGILDLDQDVKAAGGGPFDPRAYAASRNLFQQAA